MKTKLSSIGERLIESYEKDIAALEQQLIDIQHQLSEKTESKIKDLNYLLELLKDE